MKPGRRKKMVQTKSLVLKVTCVGEPAVDDGGPKRDFFLQVIFQN